MFFFLKISYRTSLFSHRKASIFTRWNGGNNKLPGKGLSSIIASKSAAQTSPINQELLFSYSSRQESFSSSTWALGKSLLSRNSFTPVRGPTQIGLRDRYEEKRGMAVTSVFGRILKTANAKLEGYHDHYAQQIGGTKDIKIDNHVIPVLYDSTTYTATSSKMVLIKGQWYSCKSRSKFRWTSERPVCESYWSGFEKYRCLYSDDF